MTPRETLARNLRLLRAERDLSLTEVEERAHVTRETVEALEHAKRGAHTGTLEKLANFYGTTIPDLFSEDLYAAVAGKVIAPAA